VDHSFLICTNRYPSVGERERAKQLLAWSDGDIGLAAKRLINALLGQP
jgi:hypothetical protein